MASVRWPTSMASSSLLSGSIATQTHWGERSRRSDGLGRADRAVLDRAEQGKELIELDLPHAHIVQDMSREGLQLLCRFAQPLQHRIRVHLEHARRAPDT